jgi:Uma2 family endonuclease
MATLPNPHLMTAEDLMRLPDDGNFHELDEGSLISMPPSSARSSRVGTLLLIKLGGVVLEHDLGMVMGEQGGVMLSRSPDVVRAPDISFVRRERMVDTGHGYFPGAPDLVVEVLSPSDRFSAVARTVSQYLASGTRLVWVIDPEERSVTVYRPGNLVTILPEDGVLDGEDVVPGFRLPLTEIWV